MEHVTSQVFTRAVDSVRIPLEHFLKTGFWDPTSLEDWQPADMSYSQTRRACRQMAKELKRPFIRCHDRYSNYRFDANVGWVRLDTSEWECGYVEMPKRKKYMPLAAPLLLAANSKSVQDRSGTTLWEFQVHDRQLWDDFYPYLLNDPVCRAARGLPPVTE